MKRNDNETLFAIGVVAFIALTTGGVAVYGKIRGIRNNNPGNIRKTGTRWQGMKPDAEQTDASFIVFLLPEWGIRAIARILNTYNKQGVSTIRGIIGRWAPPVENDTGAYVNAVSKAVGIAPDAPVNLSVHMVPLVKAIIRHENGIQPYSDNTINGGIALA